MEGNYKFLSTASTVFMVLAWAGLVLGLISAGIIFSGIDDTGTPRWMGVISFLAGGMYFLVFFTGSEVIRLLLDMNERIK